MWRFSLGLVLTAIAGAIDAVSFMRFGAAFPSFMSGNTVQIGLHTATRDFEAIWSFGLPVALFVSGGFIGSTAILTCGAWHLPLVLMLQAAIVAAVVWLDRGGGTALTTMAPLSLAMGLQNSTVVLVRGANPATTFVTGTLVRFADALAQRVWGRDAAGAWKLHLAVWLAFGLGAGLGTVSQLRLGPDALLPILLTIGLLALATLAERVVHRPRSPER